MELAHSSARCPMCACSFFRGAFGDEPPLVGREEGLDLFDEAGQAGFGVRLDRQVTRSVPTTSATDDVEIRRQQSRTLDRG